MKHIGRLNGKVLLFGGVYSNLQALERVIDISDALGLPPENCICTGDIIGYCGQPEETIQRFRKWGAQSIAGNVEIQLGKSEPTCGCDFTLGSRCDDFSKNWYPFAKRMLSKESIHWIQQLPNHIAFDYYGKRVGVVHGSFENVSEYIYESTPWKIKKANFITSKTNLIIAGHSGLPFHQMLEDKQWINAGVIGMPANDGSTNTWAVILDQMDGSIENKFFKIVYDFEEAHKNMISQSLPAEYAKTLLTGLWDNMELLPEAEKRLRGLTYQINNRKQSV